LQGGNRKYGILFGCGAPRQIKPQVHLPVNYQPDPVGVFTFGKQSVTVKVLLFPPPFIDRLQLVLIKFLEDVVC
jgi:hypothetical protein